MATKSLYVGNLPYNTSEDAIRDMFNQYGPISEVRIIGDKGFAFIEIPEENAQAAINATNGKDLGGRTLTVNEARPRRQRSDFRGGGGGRSDRGRGGPVGGGGGRRRW